jgi:hypothetical protein
MPESMDTDPAVSAARVLATPARRAAAACAAYVALAVA